MQFPKERLREVILAKLEEGARSGVPLEGTAEILANWVEGIVLIEVANAQCLPSEE